MADTEAVERLEAATPEQIERANDAVLANLDEMGVPKYGSAFGYACALTAIMQADALTRTPPIDVEAVARAICKASREHWFGSERWMRENEKWREQARAAIAAMCANEEKS